MMQLQEILLFQAERFIQRHDRDGSNTLDAKELKEAGFEPYRLKELGYKPREMWEAEIPAKEMHKIHFSARELYDGGYTAQQMKDSRAYRSICICLQI